MGVLKTRKCCIFNTLVDALTSQNTHWLTLKTGTFYVFCVRRRRVGSLPFVYLGVCMHCWPVCRCVFKSVTQIDNLLFFISNANSELPV